MTKARAEKTAISNNKQKPEAAEVAGPNGSRPPGVEVLFARTHACSMLVERNSRALFN